MRDDTTTPDPELRAALRGLEGEPPVEAVDWEGLRGRLRARAELPLARRRRAAGGAGHRLRTLVPLAVAAGLAGVAWLGGVGREAAPPPSAPPTAEIAAEALLRDDLSEREFRMLVSGRADPEALLQIAAGES